MVKEQINKLRNLEDCIELRGMGYQEVADKAGITRMQLYNLRKQKSGCTLDTAFALCGVLGCTMHILTGFKD